MKRWITKLVVFLLLGAVVNVGVAWGIAICPVDRESLLGRVYAGFQYYEQYLSDGRLYLTTVNILPGEIHLSQRVSETTLLRYSFAPAPLNEADFRALVPTWSRFAAGEPLEELANRYHTNHELVDYTEYASGWPAYSLRFFGPFYVVPAGSGNVSYDSRLTGYLYFTLPYKMVERGYGSELPLLPIWPGFAINTIFYATILWMLALAPFTARRIIRRKRGLCLNCGYDLRGTAQMICSECGHEVRAEAGT